MVLLSQSVLATNVLPKKVVPIAAYEYLRSIPGTAAIGMKRGPSYINSRASFFGHVSRSFTSKDMLKTHLLLQILLQTTFGTSSEVAHEGWKPGSIIVIDDGSWIYTVGNLMALP